MTPDTPLPKGILPKHIHAKFSEACKKDGQAMKEASEFLRMPVSEQSVFQREQGYFSGAKTEYLRAQPLVEALQQFISHHESGILPNKLAYDFAKLKLQQYNHE